MAFAQKVVEFAGDIGAQFAGTERALSSDTFDQGSVVVSKRQADKMAERTRLIDVNAQLCTSECAARVRMRAHTTLMHRAHAHSILCMPIVCSDCFRCLRGGGEVALLPWSQPPSLLRAHTQSAGCAYSHFWVRAVKLKMDKLVKAGTVDASHAQVRRARTGGGGGLGLRLFAVDRSASAQRHCLLDAAVRCIVFIMCGVIFSCQEVGAV
jgi:hypothetical protein